MGLEGAKVETQPGRWSSVVAEEVLLSEMVRKKMEEEQVLEGTDFREVPSILDVLNLRCLCCSQMGKLEDSGAWKG